MSFVSKSCGGEFCRCGEPATSKIEEVIFHDDPNPYRHPLVAYTCTTCFQIIFGILLPLNEVVKLLDVTEPTITNWLKGGHFPGAQEIKGEWYYLKSDFNAVLDRIKELKALNEASNFSPPCVDGDDS